MTGIQLPNHVLVTPLPQHAVTKPLSVEVLAVSLRCEVMVLRAARNEPTVGVHYPDEPDRIFSHDTGMFLSRQDDRKRKCWVVICTAGHSSSYLPLP